MDKLNTCGDNVCRKTTPKCVDNVDNIFKFSKKPINIRGKVLTIIHSDVNINVDIGVEKIYPVDLT